MTTLGSPAEAKGLLFSSAAVTPSMVSICMVNGNRWLLHDHPAHDEGSWTVIVYMSQR